MINFTKQLDTGVAATVYDIAIVHVDRMSDTADITILGYLDQAAKDAGKHFLTSETVHLTGIAAMFPGANGAFEQAILAMKDTPFPGGKQV